VSTTTAPLPRYSPVCWSTGNATRVGTLLPPTADTPAGHSRVLTPAGVLNVMTLALRPYEPTPEQVAEMRGWVTDCAPHDDDVELVELTPDVDIIAFVGRQCTDGHGLFVD
jgi:hypothetical protein